MKKTILRRSLLALCLLAAGLGWHFQTYVKQHVGVLAYHAVNAEPDKYTMDPAMFEAHVKELAARGYHGITLAQAVAAWRGEGDLPPYPVVFTFDDGYRDNLTVALPILQKYGFTATVFVATDLMGTRNYLTWDEVRELQRQGVEIGSHTASHVALAKLAPDAVRQELTRSQAAIRGQTGQAPLTLAYPFGSRSPEVEAQLPQAGYLAACTGKAGWNGARTNPYQLRRVNMPAPSFGLWEFRVRILRSQLWGWVGL